MEAVKFYFKTNLTKAINSGDSKTIQEMFWKLISDIEKLSNEVSSLKFQISNIQNRLELRDELDKINRKFKP